MEITTTHMLIAGGIVLWAIGGFYARKMARKMRDKQRAEGKEIKEPHPGLKFVILGAIALGFAVVIGPGILAERHHDHLVETGTKAQAEILSVRETGNVYNRRPEVALTLEVNPKGGEKFESRAKWIFSVMDIQTYKVGETVDVFFDPQDTDVVAVVGVAKD